MLQILKDIAANRMPSVADLLKQASQAAAAAPSGSTNKTAMAGQIRSVAAGKPSSRSSPQKPSGSPQKPSGIPAVVDQESSQQPAGKKTNPPPPSKRPNPTRVWDCRPRRSSEAAAQERQGAAGRQEDGRGDQKTTGSAGRIREGRRRAEARCWPSWRGARSSSGSKRPSRLQYAIAGRIGEQVSQSFRRAGR